MKPSIQKLLDSYEPSPISEVSAKAANGLLNSSASPESISAIGELEEVGGVRPAEAASVGSPSNVNA